MWLFRTVPGIGSGSIYRQRAGSFTNSHGNGQWNLHFGLPLAGSLLQELMDWQGSFYVFAVIAALVFVKALVSLENLPINNTGPRISILRAYRRICSNFSFVAYWLIAAIVFACHFSFIVISPLIFMEQLQLSSYEFSQTLLLYGAAYVTGGVLAGVMNKHLEAGTQIVIGLLLIFVAG